VERSIAASAIEPARMNNLHQLSGGHAILDIDSNLVANVRQFQQFLLDQRVVSFLGQFSILSGFVSKVIIPVHARPAKKFGLARTVNRRTAGITTGPSQLLAFTRILPSRSAFITTVASSAFFRDFGGWVRPTRRPNLSDSRTTFVGPVSALIGEVGSVLTASGWQHGGKNHNTHYDPCGADSEQAFRGFSGRPEIRGGQSMQLRASAMARYPSGTPAFRMPSIARCRPARRTGLLLGELQSNWRMVKAGSSADPAVATVRASPNSPRSANAAAR
jgi:hypothetical protein